MTSHSNGTPSSGITSGEIVEVDENKLSENEKGLMRRLPKLSATEARQKAMKRSILLAFFILEGVEKAFVSVRFVCT